MKRIEFLYRLISSAAGIFLAWSSGLRLRRSSYTLYEGWIAGYTYYDGAKIEKQLRSGMSVEMHREPDNPYDHRAIEIYAGSNKLGYISRSDNRVLANMLDNNERLKAEIAEVRLDMPEWQRVKIRVRF